MPLFQQVSNEAYTPTLRKHVMRTFLWMFGGIIISAIVAFFTYSSDFILVIYSNTFFIIGLFIAQIGVAIAFSTRLMKFSITTARLLFIVYAALLGFTLSSILILYVPGDIVIAFGVTSIYFASLSAIGFTTKINLLRFGPLLYISLFVIIIVEVIMMLMGVGLDSMLLSGICILLFSMITAYDVQKMKALYDKNAENPSMLEKLSVYSAFELFLDFINLFIYILRMLGNKN